MPIYKNRYSGQSTVQYITLIQIPDNSMPKWKVSQPARML